MSARAVNPLNLDRWLDELALGRFHVKLLIASFLAIFTDGYDIAVMGFAAPELIRTLHWDSVSLGPLFSASLVGGMVGAPLMGYFGDRFGRKPVILIGCLLYGSTTLAVMTTNSLVEMGILRFVAGIGMGGVMPNLLALKAELYPKRWRASLVALAGSGVALGAATPGLVVAWLVPQYGWHVLFVVGGVLPIVVAAGLYFGLPESLKYLASRPNAREQVLRRLRRLRPDLPLDVQIVTTPAPRADGIGLREAFSGGLGRITALLWVSFAMGTMTNYLLGNWLPVLLGASGLSAERAALASSLFSACGMLGGMTTGVLLDRYGAYAAAGAFGLGAVSIALLGSGSGSLAVLLPLIGLSGFFMLSTLAACTTMPGLLYPSAFRARGTGWVLAVGRIGAICGPLLGGALVAMNLKVSQIFLVAALPLAIGTVATLWLAPAFARKYGLRSSAEPSQGAPVEYRASA